MFVLEVLYTLFTPGNVDMSGTTIIFYMESFIVFPF